MLPPIELNSNFKLWGTLTPIPSRCVRMCARQLLLSLLSIHFRSSQRCREKFEPESTGTHLPWDLAPTPVREGKVKVTTLIYTNYSSNIYILNLGNKMAREGGRFLSLTHFMVLANICFMSQPHEWLILQTQCYCYRLFIVSETLKMWQAVLIPSSQKLVLSAA